MERLSAMIRHEGGGENYGKRMLVGLTGEYLCRGGGGEVRGWDS